MDLEINADLHIHGLYSGATSKNMIPKIIAEQAFLKGLHLVGTGDILNEKWKNLLKEQLVTIDEAIFGYNKHDNNIEVNKTIETKFLLQTEVEDKNRVHHIIIFPSMSKVEEVKERFSKFCNTMDVDGRPKINLSGEEIAEICKEGGCLIGPSHVFTPYFGALAHCDSLKECYGNYRVDFLELGLSADTNMADTISELHSYTFLSCSDGHSPWPNKLGREFTKLFLKDVTFEEIEKAIRRKEGRKSILNVKISPLEGKYHKTRCISCLTFFGLADAKSYRWRCPICRGPIKKGVADRVYELSQINPPKVLHPTHRPPCIHILPLSEIIAISLGKKPNSETVQVLWRRLVKEFGNEIDVLTNATFDSLKRIDEKVARTIKFFRDDKIKYIPGGGGVYGIPIPPDGSGKMKVWKNGKVEVVTVGEDININLDSPQKSLSDFF